jgi:hypothetical protein
MIGARCLTAKAFHGWDIKIRGFELNENHKNTFRVEDGLAESFIR